MKELSKSQISVSVIIPVRNGIATIDRAISSVLKQVEVGEIELVVIDDGSTDGTASFISEKYPFVKLISNGGKGVSSARNTGIAHSVGRYVAFLDADDEWKSGKLIKQVNFLDCNPQYVLSACAAEYWDVDGRLLKIGKNNFDGIATNSLLNGNFIVTSSVVLRNSIIRQENIYFNEDMGLGEDWQMWIRLSARGKFSVISTPFVKYTCYSAKKYELNFLTISLQRMVDSLKADPKLADTVASKQQCINSIPAVARLGWIRQMKGKRAAAFEAIKILRKYPTRVIRVMRMLF
ncbi:MAG: glycosyltransferase family 2 protein [Methylotenera sp.]